MSSERYSPDADDEQTVLKRIDEQNVETVRLQFTDILGTIKNVTIPAHQVEKALTEGIWFDGSSINGFARVQESDMRLDPDPATFTRLPWQNGGKTARMIADVVDNDGVPFAGDPRHVLKRVAAQAADHGYELNVGPEPEFFVFETDDGEPTTRPHDSGGYFDIGPRDLAHGLRREIIRALEQMAFEVEASHHEVADGQHEIAFKYADALTTADNCATLRWVVRTIAAQRGLHATFMPKPIEGVNGSGMHTHLSLFAGDENAFHDPNDEHGLSDTAYRFLAGMIDHAPALTAVCNPTVNSYKRLVPGYEAPVYTAWSDVNRSALVRQPAAHEPASTRLELRSPDPSCNPYLAFAAILAAGLDGIERGLDAPDPVQKNIYEMSASERDAHGIDMLPGNLQEAIAALEQDAVIRDALGPGLSDKLIAAKRQEWSDYRKQVTSWEHETYLRTH